MGFGMAQAERQSRMSSQPVAAEPGGSDPTFAGSTASTRDGVGYSVAVDV
jgi:hypothetical protein